MKHASNPLPQSSIANVVRNKALIAIEGSCRQTARDLGCGRWKPRRDLPQFRLRAVTAEEPARGQNNPRMTRHRWCQR